jgi:hypothetical protein
MGRMQAKVRVSLALGLVGLASAATPAAAEASLDANCPGPPEGSVFIIDSGNERWAQTFTAQSSGVLTSAQAAVMKGPGADWLLQVAALDGAGAPTYNILASTTIPDSAVPDGDTVVSAGFASPPAVTAGQQYALILARPNFGVELRVREGNDCAGQLFASEDMGPFLLFAPDQDMVFAVFVEPSNSFIVGGVKRNKKKGTATLTLNLPNPGELSGVGGGAKVSGVAATSKAVQAGQATLVIRAKGKKKRKLNETGKVKVTPTITYTPTGGDPSTQTRKVKLRKR